MFQTDSNVFFIDVVIRLLLCLLSYEIYIVGVVFSCIIRIEYYLLCVLYGIICVIISVIISSII